MIKRNFTYNRPFRTEGGYTFDSIDICYHISDEGIPAGKKVIWITHALTANSDPSDWWSVIVGKNKIFDTDKYIIICANVLGSCYGSTGPASCCGGRKPLLADFPKLTIRDIVAQMEILARHLGIKEIELLVGGSVGGFQAVEWAYSFKESGIVNIKRVALIATNARISPWGVAFNESQRMALFADHSFAEAKDANGGKAGLAAARSIALISYRSYEGYCISQAERDDDTMFGHRCISYQNYQGKKLADRFDAYSYLSMVNLTDSHNIGRGRGGVEKALAKIEIPALCVGIDSDCLFPPSEVKQMASMLPDGKYKEIKSLFGHDGFLLEGEQLENLFKEFVFNAI